MITAEAVRELRRDAVRLPPDYLSRRDLYGMRASYIKTLFVLEREIAEREEAMRTEVTVAELSVTTLRAVIPTLLLATLAGAAAGVAVTVYRFTTNLF